MRILGGVHGKSSREVGPESADKIIQKVDLCMQSSNHHQASLQYTVDFGLFMLRE